MSLAENLLDSISENNNSNSRIAGSGSDEPHIVVDETRTIRVPDSLKTIAVKGDKDVETVTIDCIRYWDGHDLSNFDVVLNYTLPNGDNGTYVPASKTINEDTFSFDWVISRAFTLYSGQLTFWIVAKKLDENGNLLQQWSSFKNNECSIADGGSDEIYDPTVVPSCTLVFNVDRYGDLYVAYTKSNGEARRLILPPNVETTIDEIMCGSMIAMYSEQGSYIINANLININTLGTLGSCDIYSAPTESGTYRLTFDRS